MDDVYNNIDDYNPNKRRKIFITFDDMIADIMTKKKFKPQLRNYLLDAENWILFFGSKRS